MNRKDPDVAISLYSPVSLICPSSSSRMLKNKKKNKTNKLKYLLTIISDNVLVTFINKQNITHKEKQN